jgi:hypothetical protein
LQLDITPGGVQVVQAGDARGDARGDAQGRAPEQQEEADDADHEDDANSGSAAEDEADAPRKRKHEYAVTSLKEGQLDVVMEKLLARKPDGAFLLTVPQVIEFFTANFPSIGKCLSETSLRRWRKTGSALPVYGPQRKRGRRDLLSGEHRRAIALMLQAMGKAGAPLNTVISVPIILGYLEANGLMHLYAPRPAPGKISFSQTWVLDLFTEYNLADRKGTTDAQHLPEVRSCPCQSSFSGRTGRTLSSCSTTASRGSSLSTTSRPNW